MATRGIQEKLLNGTLTGIKLGGIGSEKLVLTQEEFERQLTDGTLTEVAIAEAVNFTPLAVSPEHAEGKVFYDQKHQTLCYYNSVADVTVNIGQEFVGRVYNKTGTTIPNGTPITISGVDDPTMVAEVVPAIAVGFDLSRVMGVTTHDIPNNTIGFATGRGELHGLNTSLYNSGDILYLSDTVAGGLTTDLPDILTAVGAVIYAHPTEGVIHVNPRIHISLPTTIGLLQDKSGSMDLTTSYQTVTGYTSARNTITEVNASNGTISPTDDGDYRATMNITMTVPTSPLARTIGLQVWDATDSSQKVLSTINISKDTTQVSRSFGKIISGDAGHNYVIRLSASAAISGVTFDDISFDMVSLKL